MLFTEDEIKKILTNIDLAVVKMVAQVLGKDYLTTEDLALLKKKGVDLVKLIPKFPSHYQAFLFGRVSAAVGTKATAQMTYSEFTAFLSKMGLFEPTAREMAFYKVAANKTYTHIKGFADRIKNDVRASISAEELSYLQAQDQAKADATLRKEMLEGTLAEEGVPCENIGKAYRIEDARGRYIEYAKGSIQNLSLRGLRIVLDCANGAASTTARYLFGRFPLQAEYLNDKPNGVNINEGCGSTHLEALCAAVKDGGYDLGIAFDGDADRCLTVDEQGNPIDGDRMMAICAESLEQKGRLQGDGFVATVMSNIGLHRFCKERGLRLLCANVGDRNVLELMQKEGMRLGGEQSGHIIFLDYMPTGDGQLAALQLLSILSHSKKKASELASAVRQYPQLLKNVRVSSNDQKTAIMQSASLQSAIRAAEEELGENGRVLIRPSGTEPLIRVMVEAGTQQQAQAVTDRLVQHVENLQKTTDK